MTEDASTTSQKTLHYSEPFEAETPGLGVITCQQVFEYVGGECVDRFVTIIKRAGNKT
jgi:hypothetical protein